MTTHANGSNVVRNVPNGGQYYRRHRGNRFNPGYFNNNNNNSYRNTAVAYPSNFNVNQQPQWHNHNQYRNLNENRNFFLNNPSSNQQFQNFRPPQPPQQTTNTVPIATMTTDCSDQTNLTTNQSAVTITDVTEAINQPQRQASSMQRGSC